MNPNDKALQEVKKYHNMCVRGAAQNGISFPTTLLKDMHDMNPRTESWITEFRECPNTQSIITFLKLNGGYQTLTQVFHRTAVPQEMFSKILEAIDTEIESADDWKWAGNFLIDLEETHDFEAQTLLLCTQIDNVRLEKICGKIKLIDKALAKKCFDCLIDQDWPDEDWED